MIDIEQLDTDALTRVYMLANTPRYLYRNVRAQPSIEGIARTSSPSELINAIRSIETSPTRSPSDIAQAYGLLVAMSFQEPSAVREAVAGWEPTTLVFARRLIEIITTPTVATTTLTLTGRPGQFVRPTEQIAGSTTTRELLRG